MSHKTNSSRTESQKNIELDYGPEMLRGVQQLKTKFGGKYSLELRIQEGQTAIACAFIESLAWDAQQLDANLTIVRYAIPSEGRSLAEMFETLENGKHEHGIVQYALSQTTLEQVFIQLAKEQNEDSQDE